MEEKKSIAVGEAFDFPECSIYDAFLNSVNTHSDYTAMIFYGQEISYAAFAKLVEQCAAALHARGIRKGDRVAVMLPNCPQYCIVFYACARLGAIVVQVNPMYVPREVEYTLQDSGAKALVVLDLLYSNLQSLSCLENLDVCVIVSFLVPPQLPENGKVVTWNDWMQQAHNLPEPETIDPANDPAVIQYTGGTTGRSKGAVLTHRNIVANTYQALAMTGDAGIRPGDKILTVIPLFHVYGMTVAMNYGIFNGATLILLPRFQVDEVLKTIKTYQPRFFPGVPTMYVAIANHPNVHEYGVDCIEVCNSGSAPLPLEVMKQFESKTGASLLEGYGLSEASPVTHGNRIHHVRKPGSIGIVAPGTEAGVVDLVTGETFVNIGELGELVIRGPQVMKGYWNMPEETAHTIRNGWLYTGDIARMDEDGYFYIVDRKKDMIISSGYNVYPRDVEEVLYQHPNVQEAVVVGVPDAYRGETVKAVVVLKEQADPEEMKQALDVWCRERLAPYKVPRIYEFRTELPKTAVGKILRRALREQ
jgi:long-chain acyl-CoA synthetase